MYEAFPLHWPMGYEKTHARKDSQFKQTMERSQQFLREELKRLGGRDLIISSNIPVRKDGGMYTDYMSRKIDDPGVAIYFNYKGKQISMCCDQYFRVWENIYALGKGIEALRGMSRWGVSDFLDRAFTGFTALPEARSTNIWDVLELAVKPNNVEAVKNAYKRLAKIHHPDVRNGSKEKFIILNDAYQKALCFFYNDKF